MICLFPAGHSAIVYDLLMTNLIGNPKFRISGVLMQSYFTLEMMRIVNSFVIHELFTEVDRTRLSNLSHFPFQIFKALEKTINYFSEPKFHHMSNDTYAINTMCDT